MDFDRALELSGVRLSSLRRSFKRLFVSPRYWRLLKGVNVNPQSLYRKKAGVATRNKELKFKNNYTLCRFLLKKNYLCKLRLAIIICACCDYKNLKFGLCSSDLSARFLFFSNLFFMFLDIDECNSTSHLTPCDQIDECNFTKPLTRCDQICENILGSYKCSCEKGFQLVNSYRCEGIVTILLT